MKFLQAVILALSLVLGVNSLLTAENARRIPRRLLEIQLRRMLAPGFKAAIDDAITNLLDTTVRELILTGSPDLGIPVLDPFRLDHLDLDINLDTTVQLKGVLDGVQVRNIATFVIDNIKANLLLLRLDFGLSVPEIVAEGEHYSLDGNLGGLLPVYGEGRFDASVQGLSVAGTVTLGSNNSFIYIKTLDLDINLISAKVNFEGLLGGGDLGDVANQIISDMIPSLLEELKPTLLPDVIQLLIDLANEKLDGVTIQDILDLISGGGAAKRIVHLH
jgi:hypothetical protein